MYELKVEGAFEAAHQIPNYPGKCARLHGHNWVVEATVKGTELDELGMLIDFKKVKKALADVLDGFDHRFLNEIAPSADGVNPTAETLSRIIFERLTANGIFPEGEGRAFLASVTVWESPKSSITYSAS